MESRRRMQKARRISGLTATPPQSPPNVVDTELSRSLPSMDVGHYSPSASAPAPSTSSSSSSSTPTSTLTLPSTSSSTSTSTLTLPSTPSAGRRSIMKYLQKHYRKWTWNLCRNVEIESIPNAGDIIVDLSSTSTVTSTDTNPSIDAMDIDLEMGIDMNTVTDVRAEDITEQWAHHMDVTSREVEITLMTTVNIVDG